MPAYLNLHLIKSFFLSNLLLAWQKHKALKYLLLLMIMCIVYQAIRPFDNGFETLEQITIQMNTLCKEIIDEIFNCTYSNASLTSASFLTVHVM